MENSSIRRCSYKIENVFTNDPVLDLWYGVFTTMRVDVQSLLTSCSSSVQSFLLSLSNWRYTWVVDPIKRWITTNIFVMIETIFKNMKLFTIVMDRSVSSWHPLYESKNAIIRLYFCKQCIDESTVNFTTVWKTIQTHKCVEFKNVNKSTAVLQWHNLG